MGKLQITGRILPPKKKYEDDPPTHSWKPLTLEQEQRQREAFEKQKKEDLEWERNLLKVTPTDK